MTPPPAVCLPPSSVSTSLLRSCSTIADGDHPLFEHPHCCFLSDRARTCGRSSDRGPNNVASVTRRSKSCACSSARSFLESTVDFTRGRVVGVPHPVATAPVVYTYPLFPFLCSNRGPRDSTRWNARTWIDRDRSKRRHRPVAAQAGVCADGGTKQHQPSPSPPACPGGELGEHGTTTPAANRERWQERGDATGAVTTRQPLPWPVVAAAAASAAAAAAAAAPGSGVCGSQPRALSRCCSCWFAAFPARRAANTFTTTANTGDRGSSVFSS